jgi:hypothetical protein
MSLVLNSMLEFAVPHPESCCKALFHTVSNILFL